MNTKVDFYFNKEKRWQKALQYLRRIVFDCGLDEELKWGCPCYTYQGKNIVLIHDFKEYCALLFFKGALLSDNRGILIQQTQNVQAARQIRFIEANEPIEMEAVLKAYIYEAIEVEKAGLKVNLKPTTEFSVPEEFKTRLSGEGGQLLRTAFEALTPGRQRAYLLHFSAAKQTETRQARIEKCIPRILLGKRLKD